MKELPQSFRIEPRWPAVLAILATLMLLVSLPVLFRLLPLWLSFVVGSALIVPMVAVMGARKTSLWLRIEYVTMLIFVVLTVVGVIANLWNLVGVLVRGSAEVGGVRLLASGVAVWVTNILAFSLLYWRVDRGGPEFRLNRAGAKGDWLFPQTATPTHAPPNWQPTFVDYLYLGYSTATAFSTTEVPPLTSRAKMLMMIESTISLVTIAVVMARAINILGK